MITSLALLACFVQDPAYDEWESWVAFAEGDYVVFEIKDQGDTSRVKLAITKKEDDRITIEESVWKSNAWGDAENKILHKNGKCHDCGEVHKWETKALGKKETLDVAGQKLECVVLEISTPQLGCIRNPYREKMWYSRSVPGFAARQESVNFTATVVEFKAGGAKEKPSDAFQQDPWACWASFDKGAWVEMETTMEGSDFKSSFRTTLTSKSDREVRGERFGMADQVLATKEVKCPMPSCDKKPGEHCHTPECKKTGAHCCRCDKHKPAEEKWSREDLKIGDQTVSCHVAETTLYDCDGRQSTTTKMWYSKDVPGWLVKFKASGMTMTATGFGLK